MEQLQVSPALCDLDFGSPVCSKLKLVQSAGDSMGERHVPFQLLPPQTCPMGEGDRLSGRKFISARCLVISIYWNQVPETLP